MKQTKVSETAILSGIYLEYEEDTQGQNCHEHSGQPKTLTLKSLVEILNFATFEREFSSHLEVW